jgi:hypothetical protein
MTFKRTLEAFALARTIAEDPTPSPSAFAFAFLSATAATPEIPPGKLPHLVVNNDAPEAPEIKISPSPESKRELK